jgi:predicted phage tail component-like protein
MLNYKGISSEGKLKVLKVTRSVLPPSSNKLMEIDGKSGALFISKKHGVKKIEVEIAIVGDYVSKKREIADWLDADKPEALVIEDEPDKTDFAIIDGDTDMDEILDNGFGTINFICPDPYSVGADRTHSFGTVTVDWSVYDLVYNGTAPVFPLVTATFNAPTTYFEMWLGEDFVKVQYNFQAGTVLEIDMNTGKVSINGTVNMQTLTLDSDFFPLKKGTNTLSASEFVDVEVSYKERFK